MRRNILISTPDGYWVCEPFLQIATRDALQSGTYKTWAPLIQQVADKKEPGISDSDLLEGQIRAIRFAFFERCSNDLVRLLDIYNEQFPEESGILYPLCELILAYPEFMKLSDLPLKIQARVCAPLVTQVTHWLLKPDPIVSGARSLLEKLEPTDQSDLRVALAVRAVCEGNLSEAETLLADQHSLSAEKTRAWCLFLRGRTDEALALYERLVAEQIQTTRGRKRRFALWHDLIGATFPLALLTTGRKEDQARSAELLKGSCKVRDYYPAIPLYAALEILCDAQQGRQTESLYRAVYDALREADKTALYLYYFLPSFWEEPESLKSFLRDLKALQQSYAAAGYRWLELECQILAASVPSEEESLEAIETARNALAQMGIQSVALRYGKAESWERALNALSALSSSAATGADQPEIAKPARLAWELSFGNQNWVYDIRPLEQKRSANGDWSKGRPVALKRLMEKSDKKFPFLTDQDWKVCQCISVEYSGNGYYGRRSEYCLKIERALLSLIGHPHLYRRDSDTPIELVRGEPVLQVTRKGEAIAVSLRPQISENPASCVVDEETPTRFRVIEVTEPLKQLAGILKNGLKVPATARERVLETIASIAHIATVHSDVGGDFLSDLPVEEVPTDSRPLMHLMPDGRGLKLELFVRPLGASGPCHCPGTGGEMVLAEVDGKRVRVNRDLGEERLRAAQVVEACPALEHAAEGDFRWALDDPEECLDTLLALQELGDQATMEWPQGGRMHVQTGAFSSFQGAIRSQREWFSASGEMRVDNDLVLNLRQLIELTEASAGRFVSLGEGRFLALTREFRRRLDEMRFLGEVHGDEVRISPLAALAFEEATSGLGKFKADKKWKEAMARVEEAMARTTAVPKTLQAELRDYQIEGYQWLDRLAHWGVGACLADDMGLGKTLQALALILSRTAAGPALVVAPTSVCLNWVAEAGRFAPTLNPVVFGAGDRKQTLDDLGPGDLLLVTYTLLQQEADLFAEREWGTVVLDEAQAIKNMATRRSKAAMRLKAGFRMLTTGTPIENHLGELWNLFRFINPGLLGSIERFNTRFANPIERDGNKEARLRLKKLIQPFILRRTKSQVLEELPARTEILRHVTLSTQETAFYEALRLKAIEAIEANPEEAGQKRFRVLAEIMRLRRACCNVELVTPGLNLPSSRLAVFGELIDELVEGHHKALVFSQFVDHLALIRTSLDEKKIAYQYLDGSTPAAERKRRVDAFQAGEGDVFLISLRAGGLGLNLTAADYVIHMDPWWNPAVEDQASDRAHRIGQQRPVTIYRLIAENTIEQKIVALHEHKRDLADGLLDGTDMGARISTEDLVQLLRESA
ncbi:MAG TPA: DEAD/DEAH box helicase, partial [Candidatus Sumerlaeota bacterium]|nr:DEAD/DEAH box helicase [Candidatus Sumerlaeota bacterium]